MLQKFKCQYTVKFYGAVFVPGNRCMVTEFAKYGSLKGFMKSRKDKPLSERMRIKILLDAARGLECLHKNKIML